MVKHLQSYLSDWLQREPGVLLLAMERTQIERTLQEMLKPAAGDYLVQIGGLSELSALSAIRHKYYFSTEAKPGTIQIDLENLPLARNSVDVILIVHVLEFIMQPRHLLNELNQALVPGGQLIIINLNPWSLWGLKHAFTFKRRFPWKGHFWSIWHVKNWLRWIGFRIVTFDTFCFRPPVKTITWWRRLLWMEALGSFCFPGAGCIFSDCRSETWTEISRQTFKNMVKKNCY